MNTPLVIIQRLFPQEVVNIIQSFMRNDIVYQAIDEYFYYLFYQEELYNNFIYNTHIVPNCYCYRIPRKKECQYCHEYESMYARTSDAYVICIEENDQFHSIYGWTHKLNAL